MDFQILVKPPPGGVGSWSAEMRVPARWVALAPEHAVEDYGTEHAVVIGRGLDGAVATRKLLERFGAAAFIVLRAHPPQPEASPPFPPPCVIPTSGPVLTVAPMPPPEPSFIERLGRSTMPKRLRDMLVDFVMDCGGGACEPSPELQQEFARLTCAWELTLYMLDHVDFSPLSDKVREARAEYFRRMRAAP